MMKLRQFVPSEVCLKCDRCCRYTEKISIWSPVFSGEEAERLINDGVPPSLFSAGIVKYTDVRIELKECDDRFICPFFNVDKNNCSVYPKRPLDCSLYPFLLIPRDGKVFIAVDCDCPYVRGKIDEGLEEHIYKFAHYLADVFKESEGAKELEQRPQMIAPYEGNLLIIEELR